MWGNKGKPHGLRYHCTTTMLTVLNGIQLKCKNHNWGSYDLCREAQTAHTPASSSSEKGISDIKILRCKRLYKITCFLRSLWIWRFWQRRQKPHPQSIQAASIAKCAQPAFVVPDEQWGHRTVGAVTLAWKSTSVCVWVCVTHTHTCMCVLYASPLRWQWLLSPGCARRTQRTSSWSAPP